MFTMTQTALLCRTLINDRMLVYICGKRQKGFGIINNELSRKFNLT